MRGRNLFIILALVIGISMGTRLGWTFMLEFSQDKYTIDAAQYKESVAKDNMLPERFPLLEGDNESKITGFYHTVRVKDIRKLATIVSVLGPVQVPLKDGRMVTVTNIERYRTFFGLIPWGYSVFYKDSEGNTKRLHSKEFGEIWKDHLYVRADAKIALNVALETESGERKGLGREKMMELSKKINEYSVVLSYRKNDIEWDNVSILHSAKYDSTTGDINVYMVAANKDILKIIVKHFFIVVRSYLKDILKDTETEMDLIQV